MHPVFLHSGIGIAVVSLEGKFLAVNPALCGYLGYSEDEFLELDFQTITHPGDLARDLENVRKMRRGEIDSYSIEKRYIHKDGRDFWGLLTVSLVRDAEKQPHYFLSQIQDVTDRRRADEALWISRERLRQATAAGGVGTWDFDVRTGVLDWNDVTFEIFGVSRETFVPQWDSTFRFIHPEDIMRERRHMEQSLMGRSRSFRSECRIVRPGGEVRYLRTGAEIVRDAEGNPERVVGVLIDFTNEMRALKAAEAATQAKSDFLAMTSHEIRTPMNGVLGFAALLRETHLDAAQRSYLATIEASGRRLLKVINDILDFSRMEAGSLTMESAPFDVRHCVADVFEILRPTAAAKGLTYELSIDSDVPQGMLGDRGRLAQILTNLLGNAVKFTKEGSVTLGVSFSEAGEGDPRWTFRVQDSGPGVPPEALTRVFDPFYQADHRYTREGTGLGLAICENLVRLLGGKITVSNSASGGAEFCVAFRAKAVEVPQRILTETEHDFGGSRILVVEDNEVNRRLCGLQLRRLGCEPVFAENGREALEKIAGNRIHAILMDVQLPEMDGCEVTKRIRLQENGSGPVPIIAMTANAMAQDRENCLAAGMNDYLSKPVRTEDLGAVLAKWLDAGPFKECLKAG